MRFRQVFPSLLILAACHTAPGTNSESRAPDSIVDFLLTSAATDFHAHRPPDPVRFRVVRIGRMTTESGAEQFMLCGEFLPESEGGTANWTPFATIKTSGYEQWIGAQAVGFCQSSGIAWDKSDLSTSLQRRLDAQR